MPKGMLATNTARLTAEMKATMTSVGQQKNIWFHSKYLISLETNMVYSPATVIRLLWSPQAPAGAFGGANLGQLF